MYDGGRARYQIMSVDCEYSEAMEEWKDRIESLKKQKAKDQLAFTRIKNIL